MPFPKRFLIEPETSKKLFNCPTCKSLFSAKDQWKREKDSVNRVFFCGNPDCNAIHPDGNSPSTSKYFAGPKIVPVTRAEKKDQEQKNLNYTRMAIDTLLNPTAQQIATRKRAESSSSGLVSTHGVMSGVAKNTPSLSFDKFKKAGIARMQVGASSSQTIQIAQQPDAKRVKTTQEPIANVDEVATPPGKNATISATKPFLNGEPSNVTDDDDFPEDGPVPLFDCVDENITPSQCRKLTNNYHPIMVPLFVLDDESHEAPVQTTTNRDIGLEELLCSEDELGSERGLDFGLNLGSGMRMNAAMNLSLGSELRSPWGSTLAQTTSVNNGMHNVQAGVISMDNFMETIGLANPQRFSSTTGPVSAPSVNNPMEGNTDDTM